MNVSVSAVATVAAGGAVGAVARYLSVTAIGQWLGMGFPYGTLAVNVIGSFVLGALINVFAVVWSPSAEARLFLVVGMLGAFTTFSTFSLDTVFLFERKAYGAMALYVAVSLTVSIAAFFAGMRLMRLVLA